MSINLKWRRETKKAGQPAEVLAAVHGAIDVEAIVQTIEGNLVLVEAHYRPYRSGYEYKRVKQSGVFWRDLEVAVAAFSQQRQGLIDATGETV